MTEPGRVWIWLAYYDEHGAELDRIMAEANGAEKMAIPLDAQHLRVTVSGAWTPGEPHGRSL